VVAAAQLLVDKMTLSMSSFALRKNFSASSRLTLALLIKMIVRIFVMPVLFDVQICSIYRELLVALAHFSSAGILAISAGDRIVPVLTSDWAVESIGISLRVTVAFDVRFFNAGITGAEKSAVEIDVVSWTTFAACEDVVRVVGHAVATVAVIKLHRILRIRFIFSVACNRVFELDSCRYLALAHHS